MLVGFGVGETRFVEDGIKQAVIVDVLEGFELAWVEIAKRCAKRHLDGEGLDPLGEVGQGTFEFVALAHGPIQEGDRFFVDGVFDLLGGEGIKFKASTIPS